MMDFFTQFCGRTEDPNEADFFYLPIVRDVRAIHPICVQTLFSRLSVALLFVCPGGVQSIKPEAQQQEALADRARPPPRAGEE